MGGIEKKTKLMLYSTLVQIEVRVKLGNKIENNRGLSCAKLRESLDLFDFNMTHAYAYSD